MTPKLTGEGGAAAEAVKKITSKALGPLFPHI